MNRTGRGGRIDDRGRNLNINHSSGTHIIENERPSVFERLGTRRFARDSSAGSGGFYSVTDYGHGLTEKKSLASSVVPVRKQDFSDRSSGYNPSEMKYHHHQKHSGYKSRSRSRSLTPQYKRGGSALSPSVAGTSKKSHSLQKMDSFAKHSKKESRQVHGKLKKEGNKHKEMSSAKLKKKQAKLKAKLKTSSTDSSSPTSSKSESSSTSEVSSSTPSDSSSSESSAPSIKLKTGKKKRNNSGERETPVKEKEKYTKEIPSSSSSIVSANYDYKSSKIMGRGRSPHLLGGRGYSREHEYGGKYVSASGSAKVSRYARSRESDSVERVGERESFRKDPYENRKRKHSVESFGSGGKRIRHANLTPSPDRYKSSRHSRTPHRMISPGSSHNKRIYTPDTKRSPEMFQEHKLRRQRTPTVPERMRVIKPDDKELYYDEVHHRRQDRHLERPRDRQEGGRYSPRYEGAPYESQQHKRPRERLAPARSSSPARARQAPPLPQRNFDGPPISRRAPLLPPPRDMGEIQRPAFQPKPHYQRDFQTHHRPPMARFANPNLPRNQGYQHQGPLIVKTREALIQKYEEGNRLSRVDMWVDETLSKDPGRPPLLPTPTYTPASYRHPPAIKTEIKSPVTKPEIIVPTKITVQSEKAIAAAITNEAFKPETLEQELSDFSDDAEEILNENVEEKPDQGVGDMGSVIKSTDEKPETMSVQDSREMRSNTGTHTEDDILERLDFEEISDDELGEAEQKVTIVDVLGVDWASLINIEKPKSEDEEAEDKLDGDRKKLKLRDRWCAACRFRDTGVPKELFGEEAFNKIYADIQVFEENADVPLEERTTKQELEYPHLRRKRLAKAKFMKKFQKVSALSAFTAHKDIELRRVLMDQPIDDSIMYENCIPIPRKQAETTSTTVGADETDLELFRQSIALFQQA